MRRYLSSAPSFLFGSLSNQSRLPTQVLRRSVLQPANSLGFSPLFHSSSPFVAKRSVISTTSVFDSKLLRSVVLRMIPYIDDKIEEQPVQDIRAINGAATLTIPGIDISTFAARGTNVGVSGTFLAKSIWELYWLDAYTNSVGWNRDGFSECEYPSSDQIKAAWQPRLSAIAASVVYHMIHQKEKHYVVQFSHNEVRASFDKDNFLGTILLDSGSVRNPKIVAFYKKISELFEKDDLFLYRGGNFYRLNLDEKIDSQAFKFKDDVITVENLKTNPPMLKMMQEEYRSHIDCIARKYYEEEFHGEIKKELEVAREYAKSSPLFKVYYDDVIKVIDDLNRQDPEKYPKIELKQISVAVPINVANLPEKPLLALQDDKPSSCFSHTEASQLDSYNSREWINAGGD